MHEACINFPLGVPTASYDDWKRSHHIVGLLDTVNEERIKDPTSLCLGGFTGLLLWTKITQVQSYSRSWIYPDKRVVQFPFNSLKSWLFVGIP